MKICIVTDTHFGVKNDDQRMNDYANHYFNDFVFPYMKQNNIDHIFHLGDLVDKRKVLHNNTYNAIIESFINPILKNNYQLYIITGNHDSLLKDTNKINFLRNIFGDLYDNIKVIDNEPLIVNHIDKKNFIFVPWITNDNKEQCLNLLSKGKYDACFGHFELSGFKIQKNILSEHGDDITMFGGCTTVLSGHYHFKSSRNNVHYLGSAYELNWGDAGDERGFHVFDTETLNHTFIPYKIPLFVNINYGSAHLLDSYHNKFVRIYVDHTKLQDKEYRKEFDDCVASISNHNPYELNIIENLKSEILSFNKEEKSETDIFDFKLMVDTYIKERYKEKSNNIQLSIINTINQKYDSIY